MQSCMVMVVEIYIAKTPSDCCQKRPLLKFESGSYLSFRAVTSQVLSAFVGLTSVFGMGTGGSPQLSPPEIV